MALDPATAKLIAKVVISQITDEEKRQRLIIGIIMVTIVTIIFISIKLSIKKLSKKANDVFVLNNTAYLNDIASNTVKVTSILIRNCNNFARK